ncbi:hypothetical protein [Microbacterium sp. RU33B]|uniref:hypothetical protein n=1 Tax=Microbacterium sp. RU33B TaxID=1907390 RepID=UPI000968EA88|nr:hypothetical protein [Microbacterium sp. RU33B]SIT69944.1 hypothetical protein SAMN05880545_0610 [Microbacterium sp. RU33B]
MTAASAPTSRDGRARRGRGILQAVAVLSCAALLGATAAGGVAWALWSDALVNPSLQVAADAKVGISFGRVGEAPAFATGASSVLEETVGLQDGQDMSTLSNISIPLAVTMRADGNAGMTYSIDLPIFQPGTLFDVSIVRLFPLPTATSDDEARLACRLDAAPATQPPTSGIVGIAPGVDASAPDGRAVDYWCLSIYYRDGGGFYLNTGVASAQSPSGPVSGQSSWFALVVDPGTYTLTHTVTLPGGP